MGRIIAKRLKGMNWMAKISLMLIFTLVFSTFMYQGWYKPKEAQAAHTLDTSAMAATLQLTTPATLSYTCGAGTTVLVVMIAHTQISRTGGAPTYNAIAMTQVGSEVLNAQEVGAEIWYLIGPPTGSAYTISVPNTGLLGQRIYAASFKAAVGKTSALDVNNSTNVDILDPSLGLTTTVNGDAVVDILADGGAAVPTARSHTLISNADEGAWVNEAQYALQGTLGLITLSHTIASDDVAMIAAAFKEVVAAATTTLATGSDPAANTIAPGAGATDVDLFTLQTDSGTEAIASVTVNLSTASGVGRLAITDNSNTELGFTTSPATGANIITVSGMSAGTSLTTFKVRVTPLSHAAMPAVPGANYSITAPVTAWAGPNTHAGSDTNPNALTIDNASPNGATAVSGSAGSAKVTINWTASISTDFNTTSGSVIYRWAAVSAGAEVPAEGSTASIGGINGAATAACVVSSAISAVLSKIDGTGGSAECTNVALTNGQPYTYKAFQKDTNGNYDVGVSIGTYTPTAPGNLAVANGTNPGDANAPRSSTNNALDGFTLAMSAGSGTVSTLTVTGSVNFNSTNIPTNGVKIYRDAGTLGVYDSGVDTLISSGSSAIAGNVTTVTLAGAETVTTSAANYLVTVDINAAATLAQTFTGTVTAATGTGLGTPTYGDSGSATLTVSAAQTLTFGEGTNPASANAPQSSTNRALDGFTLSLNSGSGTVSTLTVTGSANFTATNIPTNGVKIYRDAGTLGVYDSGVDTLISSGSSAIAGNVTTVTLAAAETVTTSAANYLVTVDINAGATLTQTFTGTISAATGSGIGTPVDSDTGSATLTITGASLPSTITSCAGCHGYGAITDGTARNSPAGTFMGSHNQHVVTYSYVCNVCHVVPATETSTDYKHRNGNIQMDSGKVTYTKAASWAQTNTPSAFTPCTNTACHGDSTNTSAEVGNWGTSLSASDACTVCHGTKTAGADGSAAEINRAPGGLATGFDTGTIGTPFTRNVSGDTEIGAHDGHLRGVALISNPIACTECHAVPVVSVTGIKGHLNGTPADMTFGTLANKNNTIVPAFNPATHTCSTVYCHNEAYFSTAMHTDGGTDTTPTWNNITYFGDNVPPLTSTECGRCHFYDATDCSGCHSHVNADDLSFGNKALHIDGIVQGAGDCTGCHASAQTDGTGPTRRAMVGEFNSTWSHKRTASGVVTKFDCGVCHMEGDPLTGATTGLHKDNKLDFRDPDTGATIQGVTFTAGNVQGSYTSSGSPITAAAFARNTNTNTLEPFAQAVMVNLCLKCHDSGGAASTLARVSGGTATKPFGATAGTVLDINAHFATGNASYHPIRGRQNNSYADANSMVVPWNTGGSPGGTKATKTVTTNWGWLMTCWDCHDSSLAGRTIGGATAPSVTHGNAVTLRAAYIRTASTTVATPLCVVCHKTLVYWGTVLADSQGKSAFDNTTVDYGHNNLANARMDKSDAVFTGCQDCHGTGVADPGRPIRAEDVHGFNLLPGGAATWGTTGAKPWGFIRNTSRLEFWGPRGYNNATKGTCNGSLCASKAPHTTGTVVTYDPGGTY